MKKKTGWMSAIGSGAVTFVAIILVALAAALVIVPKAMGGMSLTVLTPSMKPHINPGDVVVTKGIQTSDARDLRIGDVITFLPYPDDPMLVTHRIVAQTVGAKGYSFITQGDNNNIVDTWGPVNDFQIRGKVVYVIPKIGYVRQWLGDSTQWFVVGAAVLLLGYAAISFTTSFRKPKQEESDEGDGTVPRHSMVE